MRRRTVTAALCAAVVVAGVVAGCAGDGAGRAERAAERQLGVTSTTAAVPTSTAAAGSDDTTTTSTAPTAGDCPEPTATLTSGPATLDVGGVAREYLLQLPDGFDPTTRAPVILNFHGSNSDMNQQAAYSQLPARGGARGYLVVTPQGTGTPRGWSLAGPGTDDAFVEALLAAVGTGACVDRDRIFAVGISNGSAYAALMACRHPDLIAGVGMVAATLVSLCPVEDPMPAMAFHGTDDKIVPYAGGGVSGNREGVRAPGAEGAIAQWAERNGCPATPTEAAIGTDVTQRSWTGCTDDASVTFFSVRGGGHTWPGAIDLSKVGKDYLGATTQSVSATDRFLDFFDAVRPG